jgi:hypothetical protein
MGGSIFLYAALMIILGPGIMLFGVLITVRQRVRLTPDKVLDGGFAVIAGIISMIIGFSFTYFFCVWLGFSPLEPIPVGRETTCFQGPDSPTGIGS